MGATATVERGRRWKRALAALALALPGLVPVPPAVAADIPADGGSIPWVVYYADKEPVESLLHYQVLVLDSTYHPPLQRLRDRDRVLLGYLSLGEVEQHRPWFEQVKGWGILGGENPNWKGSYYVDVRDRRWIKLVVEKLVPDLIHKGFDGVFLDTLDNPPHLERTEPKRYAGMTKAAARLVKAIHLNWPNAPIMMNRGYELLPEVAGVLSYALGESVLTTWNFALEKAQWQAPADAEFQIAALKDAKARNPALAVMTLDYWDPTDTATVREIYARQRANGFSPYVSVVSLDRVFPEPKAPGEVGGAATPGATAPVPARRP